MRQQSPVRASDIGEIIFTLGVSDLIDPKTKNEVNIPEITMHVPPFNMGYEYKKIIHREKTRGGWYEQHWGEELDTISIQASTGSFQILGSGLATEQRYNSLAKIKFQQIFYLFKNNGCVFDDTGNIVAQGKVFIDLKNDGLILYGQFENFSWEESAESPYKWDFTFTFQITESVRSL